MIHIRVQEKEGKITELRIFGHAESDDIGKDLICAAVSSVAFGLCNALDELSDSAGFEIQDNDIRIYLPEPDNTAQIVMRTGVIQFETIAENNSDFIEIETEE